MFPWFCRFSFCKWREIRSISFEKRLSHLQCVPKDLRTAYTVGEKEAFNEHLVHIVYSDLKDRLPFYLGYRFRSNSYEGIVELLCRSTPRLEKTLIRWRDNMDKECDGTSWWSCKPCINKVQPCIRLTFSMKCMKEMTDDEIGNICKYYNLVFSDSVGTFTKISDNLGEQRSLTPPWGLFGLGYSMRDCFFTSHKINIYALGLLAEHLVQKGMLAAATAGDEDHRDDGDAGQQPQPVYAKPE